MRKLPPVPLLKGDLVHVNGTPTLWLVVRPGPGRVAVSRNGYHHPMQIEGIQRDKITLARKASK